MPAKGDGTYDGAGGSAAQPAAIHATTRRTVRRLNVFMRDAPVWELAEDYRAPLSRCYCMRRYRRFHMQPSQICSDRRNVHISRNTPLLRCNARVIDAR